MLETVGALLPPQTYFSIREVSQLTQVKAYVIRYWETQFSALRPARRESGQRKFTQKEVDSKGPQSPLESSKRIGPPGFEPGTKGL